VQIVCILVIEIEWGFVNTAAILHTTRIQFFPCLDLECHANKWSGSRASFRSPEYVYVM